MGQARRGVSRTLWRLVWVCTWFSGTRSRKKSEDVNVGWAYDTEVASIDSRDLSDA